MFSQRHLGPPVMINYHLQLSWTQYQKALQIYSNDTLQSASVMPLHNVMQPTVTSALPEVVQGIFSSDEVQKMKN